MKGEGPGWRDKALVAEFWFVVLLIGGSLAIGIWPAASAQLKTSDGPEGPSPPLSCPRK